MAKTLNNNVETVTINKIQIEKFEVNPQTNSMVIHYSKGYELNGQYVAVQKEFIDLTSVTFDSMLYAQIKESLYTTLLSQLGIS